jgi:hypothetical protein
MFVITGTQRSGTSMVAKMFIEQGYMQESWWDDEAKGGYEDAQLAGFYRWYLGDDEFPFDDFPEIRTTGTLEFAGMTKRVAKFSYLLMNPAFVYIWAKYRPANVYNDKFLVMERRPEDVVRSKLRLGQRFSHDSLLLQQDWQTLADNFFMSKAILEDKGYEFSSIFFNSLFTPIGHNVLQSALEKMSGFKIDKDIFDRVLTPEWRHF